MNRMSFYNEYLSTLSARSDKEAIGFDIKYTHFDENPNLMRSVAEAGGSAIHLVRENVLETFVSSQVMEHRLSTGAIDKSQVHGRSVPPPVKVELDVAELVSHLRNRQQRIADIQFAIESYFPSWVYLPYEGLFQSIGSTTQLSTDGRRKIEQTVSVPIQGIPQTELAKQIEGGTFEVVSNYDEVSETLRDTEFAHLAK